MSTKSSESPGPVLRAWRLLALIFHEVLLPATALFFVTFFPVWVFCALVWGPSVSDAVHSYRYWWMLVVHLAVVARFWLRLKRGAFN